MNKTANQKRFILVSRKTRMQELIQRFNTWPQARFYLEHNKVDAQDYLAEHDLYQKRLQQAEQVLKSQGPFQMLERHLLPNYQFSKEDIVVVIGQDGLVANTLKYLHEQPVIAINPDPQRWDGKLLPFEIGDLPEALQATLTDRASDKTITFAEAKTNDGQRMLAVNDLFVGPNSHISARYALKWKDKYELQSSSGVIISTGFGSSGWLQSILSGAMKITDTKDHPLQNGFAWNDQRLQFTVREPFPSNNTGVELTFGSISRDAPLIIESMMPEKGVIFSDGIESDYLEFNSGSIVTIGVSETQGRLICG